jgi:hypothetical protein
MFLRHVDACLQVPTALQHSDMSIVGVIMQHCILLGCSGFGSFQGTLLNGLNGPFYVHILALSQIMIKLTVPHVVVCFSLTLI